MVAVCKDLDSVWVWFYKEIAPVALEILSREEREERKGANPAK
jgi:hypothetical protein